MPGAKLNGYDRFFVVHRLTDDRHLDETIVAELQALGKQATAGHLTMMPDDAQVVVTYDDVWAWDFKSYLIELNVQFRGARSERGLAMGAYRQPSMFPKRPNEVVRRVLRPLFQEK